MVNYVVHRKGRTELCGRMLQQRGGVTIDKKRNDWLGERKDKIGNKKYGLVYYLRTSGDLGAPRERDRRSFEVGENGHYSATTVKDGDGGERKKIETGTTMEAILTPKGGFK